MQPIDLYLTRDVDSEVLAHTEPPVRDAAGYWTSSGSIIQVQDATAILGTYIEKTTYERALHLVINITTQKQ